ncbi:hypothetical protein YQE_03861, partial [Dendroctonus ponderosae]
MQTRHQTKRGDTTQTLTNDIAKLLDKCGNKRSSGSERPPVYWWNAEIGNLRCACATSRRRLMRARKNPKTFQQVYELTEEHKHNKSALKKEIRSSKKIKCREPCAELEKDI